MVISRSLRGGERIIQNRRGNTYESEPVCTRVFLDVFRQIAARHPFRNQLERGGSDTEERDDVWVFQAFPQHGPLVERL